MKKMLRLLCMLLVVSMLLPAQVHAYDVEPRANTSIVGASTTITKTSGTSFNITFTVKGIGLMTQIGVSMLRVQKSEDNVSWSICDTYHPSDFSQMMGSGCVTYRATVPYTVLETGCYYRVFVIYHGEDSSGQSSTMGYSNTLYI